MTSLPTWDVSCCEVLLITGITIRAANVTATRETTTTTPVQLSAAPRSESMGAGAKRGFKRESLPSELSGIGGLEIVYPPALSFTGHRDRELAEVLVELRIGGLGDRLDLDHEGDRVTAVGTDRLDLGPSFGHGLGLGALLPEGTGAGALREHLGVVVGGELLHPGEVVLGVLGVVDGPVCLAERTGRRAGRQEFVLAEGEPVENVDVLFSARGHGARRHGRQVVRGLGGALALP